MSVPNIGPELPDPSGPDHDDSVRKGNPALVYRDELPTGDVATASTRASALTHRFGGVHYPLSRPATSGTPESGESDPQD